jgi:hypothetical protein
VSKRNDASQGMVQDPAHPQGHKAPQPDTTAIFNSIQRGVNAADRAATKPRPPQKVSDVQDWRKG